jgi:hypothetical protein
MKDYTYKNTFNKSVTHILSQVLHYHIRVNKIKVPKLVEMLAENNFHTTTKGIEATLNNINHSANSLHYWAKIYGALNIDITNQSLTDLYLIAIDYNRKHLEQYHAKRKKKL